MEIYKNGSMNVQMILAGETLDNAKVVINDDFLFNHKPEVTNITLENNLLSLNIEFAPKDKSIGDIINSNNINSNLDVITTAVSNYIKNNYKELICDKLIRDHIDSLFTEDMKHNFSKAIKSKLESE